jgi:hypothetical protein
MKQKNMLARSMSCNFASTSQSRSTTKSKHLGQILRNYGVDFLNSLEYPSDHTFVSKMIKPTLPRENTSLEISSSF